MSRTSLVIFGGILAAAVVALASAWALGPTRPHPARVVVTPEVTAVYTGLSYAYVVQRGRDVLLVDAGSDPRGDAILAELARRGLGAADVGAVLVTHGHTDHVAAAALFPSARVYAGADDYELVRGDRQPSAPAPRLAAKLSRRAGPPRRLTGVMGGQLLRVGALEVETIAVPGHTPGSMMYRFAEVLFAGDSLLLAGDAVRLSEWPYADSTADNRRALSRLALVPFSVIADGHTGIAADGRARFERWAALEGVPLVPFATTQLSASRDGSSVHGSR